MDTNKDLSRRNFLFQGGKSLGLLASANVGVYVIGSAFRELDGGLVAGAKTCSYEQATPSGGGPMCIVGCDTMTVVTGATCVGGPAPTDCCDAYSTPCGCY